MSRNFRLPCAIELQPLSLTPLKMRKVEPITPGRRRQGTGWIGMDTIGMDSIRFVVSGTAGSSRAASVRTNLWRERFRGHRRPESGPEAGVAQVRTLTVTEPR